MREAGYCADPHTAVALAVAEKETRDTSVPMVVLSTAHPAKFPDAAVLQDERNLGVLLTSSTMGLNTQTGLYEELYSVGTRSFSIWTPDGVQVYDSGDDFEWITASTAPIQIRNPVVLPRK